ncbi:MAG: hypothetical protein HFH23_13660 [Ruminococcus sp.]|nr:hypothetical protein [Ruminococcus sp.]
MRQIHDQKCLNSYLERYEIPSLFDTKELSFRLYQYEAGEILDSRDGVAKNLRFIVKGGAHIYSVREDGSYYPVGVTKGFTLLGDMEFCGETELPLIVEVIRAMTCVELPLCEYRDALMDDNLFLRYLLCAVAHKLAMFVQSEAPFPDIEAKLVYYMEHDCPKGEFKGVGKVAEHLRCSRRQLQRLLKSLTEQGKVEKTGKGSYRLGKRHHE